MTSSISDDGLWTLERRFWTEGADFYAAHLAPGATMVFPEPAGIMGRQAAIDAVRDAPRWRHVHFDRQRLRRHGDDLAVLAYAVRADRGDGDSGYEALCGSVYRRTDEGWQLACHQQTPLG